MTTPGDTRPARVITLRWLEQRSERAAIAGLEGLMFGVMILLGGLILIINLWSVIDARASLDAASREFLRTYTRQSDPLTARSEGEAAARAVLSGRNSHLREPKIAVSEPNGFGPCSTVTVTISVDVPSLKAPFLEHFTPLHVSSTLSELVDAHRQMTPDTRYSPALTECFHD